MNGRHHAFDRACSAFAPPSNDRDVWLTHRTWPMLSRIPAGTPLTLPICSIGTPIAELESLGALLLPPLYHEAMDEELRAKILDRISHCLPYHRGSARRAGADHPIRVVDIPRDLRRVGDARPRVLAIGIDTAVEQHGPHLPLATDSLQTEAILRTLVAEVAGVLVGPAMEYGQLAWGLPIGWSVDLTGPLTTRYVTGFVNALIDYYRPQAIYAVCVHGSRLHHAAIRAGLAASRADHWQFRWLHEPLTPFAWAKGDAHAGGLETAMIELFCPDRIDRAWWPARREELRRHQMSLADAIAASSDLDGWIHRHPSSDWNGIVGQIENYDDLDSEHLVRLMLETARADVQDLLDSSVRSGAPKQ